LRTGVYYINYAAERAGGVRDTVYDKVGLYRDACPQR
jgi:hypothetical protein